MSHSQTLNVAEVPWLVPDDGNDYSYDTSVELSFFESSPPTQLQSRRPAPNAPGSQRGYSAVGHVPIRPLDLKRREGCWGNQRTMSEFALLLEIRTWSLILMLAHSFGVSKRDALRIRQCHPAESTYSCSASSFRHSAVAIHFHTIFQLSLVIHLLAQQRQSSAFW